VERVEQRVMRVDRAAKPAALAQVLKGEHVDRALVFTRTKHGADKVVRGLAKAGITASAIHGNKSQNQRERVLMNFRSGDLRTLVATDIAARGIDVDGISHVVNFDLPNVPETYVHRIGRTARAGAPGTAISLCDADELPFLRDIEKLIRLSIPSIHPAALSQRHRRPQPSRAAANQKHQSGKRSRPHSDAGQQHHRNVQKAARPRYPERYVPTSLVGIADVAFLQRAARPGRDNDPAPDARADRKLEMANNLFQAVAKAPPRAKRAHKLQEVRHERQAH
jgi:superfamily II DNA/RNA helicase